MTPQSVISQVNTLQSNGINNMYSKSAAACLTEEGTLNTYNHQVFSDTDNQINHNADRKSILRKGQGKRSVRFNFEDRENGKGMSWV